MKTKLLLLFIVLSFLNQTSYSQSSGGILKGKVLNRAGQPVNAASVIIKGSGEGTTTNELGTFSLPTSQQSGIIQFSHLSFISKEVAYKVGEEILVSLEEVDSLMQQVVVVGYGTQRKVGITSAVSTISGERLLDKTTSNMQQALQARIPGLTILDQGAAPGKMNMVMRIRGITTLGENEPLVIVDGIEQSLNFLNPQDIESISVLKDASSTAIYGSRAANGVILVTTKRAKKGKLSVTYSGYYAMQKSNNNPEHMGLEDYMRLQNVAWINSSGNPIYTEDYIQEYIGATDRLKYPLPYDWYDVVLKTAPQISNTITISGGNEILKSRLSARYLDQEGIVANTFSKIAELRYNADYSASDKIRLSADINLRQNNNKAPNNEFILFKSLLQNAVFTVPRYPDGTLGVSADGRSPLIFAELDGIHRVMEEYAAGGVKAEWDIFKGLQFSSQLGGRINYFNGKNYRNKFQIRDYFNPDIVKLNQPQNTLTEIRNNFREYTITNLLRYQRTFNLHAFTGLLGYSQIKNDGNDLNATRQNFYNNEIQSLSAGANDGTKDNTGADYGWGLRSYFTRLNYAFNNKYFLEGNARYDGSSRFVGQNKYSFFPSFSAGWRLSQENFWNDNLRTVINELKLRGSWGKTGNQAVALYSYLKTLMPATYSFSGNVVQGYSQRTLANEDLTWETTTQSNIGLDAQFLKSRGNFSIDYYYKRTDDILLALPVPGTLGLLAAPQNAGRMDNFGWEFTLGYNERFGDFGFNGNISLSITDNEVVDLAGTGPYITGGNETRYIVGEGYPYRSYWGYKTDGYFQNAEEILKYPTMRTDAKPGDVKFLDLNNDNKITPDDMTYLGRSFPKYVYNSNLMLDYKNFELNILLQGVSGYNARVGGALAEMGIWGGFAHKIVTNNYWTPDNRNAQFPRPLKFDNRNIMMADRDLVNGAYFRVKNVQLAYNIPASLLSFANIAQANIYVSSTNLLTFAELNKWDVDPETIPGGRTEAYPQTSLTTLGINITF